MTSFFANGRTLDSGPANFFLWGDYMAKNVIIDSAALAAALQEIEQGCFMLGFVNDEDDMDDVEYYAQRIRRAADDIRRNIKKDKPAEQKEGG